MTHTLEVSPTIAKPNKKKNSPHKVNDAEKLFIAISGSNTKEMSVKTLLSELKKWNNSK